MDDLLTSTNLLEAAIKVRDDLIMILKESDISLGKLTSNNLWVLPDSTNFSGNIID